MIEIHHELLVNAAFEAGIDIHDIHWDYDNGDRPRRHVFAFVLPNPTEVLAKFFAVLGMMAVEQFSAEKLSIDVNTVMQFAEGVVPVRGYAAPGYYFPNVTVVGYPDDEEERQQ